MNRHVALFQIPRPVLANPRLCLDRGAFIRSPHPGNQVWEVFMLELVGCYCPGMGAQGRAR